MGQKDEADYRRQRFRGFQVGRWAARLAAVPRAQLVAMPCPEHMHLQAGAAIAMVVAHPVANLAALQFCFSTERHVQSRTSTHRPPRR